MLTWGFSWWQVLGSNQRRLSRRFYRYPLTPSRPAQMHAISRICRIFSAEFLQRQGLHIHGGPKGTLTQTVAPSELANSASYNDSPSTAIRAGRLWCTGRRRPPLVSRFRRSNSACTACSSSKSDPVPLEYPVAWLTCAVADRLDMVMAGWAGAAQGRLRADLPDTRP
jgi:hypothetical protein